MSNALFWGNRSSQSDSSLALWLRRGANQFTDVGATVPATTGDAAAAWRDRDIIASQSTLANRPTRQAGGELLFASGKRMGVVNDVTHMRAGFSVAVWVNPVVQETSRIIIARDTTSGNSIREWYFLCNPTFAVATTTGSIVSNGGGSGLLPGWHLVIGTFTGSRLFLSIDGADPGEGSNWALQNILATPASAEPMNISSPVGGREYNARYGDIRIWHRALNASEIAALFAAERGSYGV
jgi:hypothetical protein